MSIPEVRHTHMDQTGNTYKHNNYKKSKADIKTQEYQQNQQANHEDHQHKALQAEESLKKRFQDQLNGRIS